jgi:hypothetical protein
MVKALNHRLITMAFHTSWAKKWQNKAKWAPIKIATPTGYPKQDIGIYIEPQPKV